MWNPFKKEVKPEPVVEKPKDIVITMKAKERASQKEAKKEFAQYEPPNGVIPEKIGKSAAMAMDSTDYGYLNQSFIANGWSGFQGYPYLSQLAQLPEYRKMVSIRAEEMTRKWIKLTCTGDEDKTERLELLEKAMKKFMLREKFREVAEHDGYFGRGQLYIDVMTPKGTTAWLDYDELETRLFMSPKKITKGSLLGFTSVEPIWTYPGMYNSDNPLDADFYVPQQWYVFGRTVHKSRMIGFVSRQVPDILKAAYNFGGLSLLQIAEPYVNNWLRTRDSVSDLIHSFVKQGIYTNMTSVLQGGECGGLFDRIEMYIKTQDNRGAMVLDKDSEEFFQMTASLTGLDSLQAQSQEHLCSVSSIPLVKYTGITPNGLNASSDGEIRVFYDSIKAEQENLFRPNLKRCLDIIQLSEFGDIDEDIDFEFIPLYEMSEKEKAETRKIDADTDAVLIGCGSISQLESRERVAADPSSPYPSMVIYDEVDEEEDEEEIESEQSENDTTDKA
jgi:phage-related protein (TIGR01555 family)